MEAKPNAKDFFGYQWARMRRAAAGGFEPANNTAAYVEYFLIVVVLSALGYRRFEPMTGEERLVWGALTLVVAWLLLFVLRFLFTTPYRMQVELAEKIRAEETENLQRRATVAQEKQAEAMQTLALKGRANSEAAAPQGGLEILFDPRDAKFVRPVPLEDGSHGSYGERYFIGIKNNSGATLNGVLLRAQHGLFVAHMIDDNYSPPGSSRRPKIGYDTLIRDFGRLDPGAFEILEIFGASYADLGKPDSVLADRHTFVLEARGLDTPTVTAEFEYNPGRRPMLRVLPRASAA